MERVNNMKALRIATLAASTALACSLSFGIVGCSQQNNTTAETNQAEETNEAAEEKAPEEQPVAEEEVVADTHEVIGTESDETYSVLVTNGMKSDVAGLHIRKNGKIKFGENLVGEGVVFNSGEEDRLCFVPKSSKDDTLYDVRLVLASGAKRAFFGVPLANAESITFKRGEGVNYVEYVLKDGTEGSTKDAALQRKAEQDEAKRAAEEQAAATDESEQASTSDEYYEEPAYEEPSYEEYYYEEPSYEEPVYEEPVYEAPAQNDDTCVPDAVFRDE